MSTILYIDPNITSQSSIRHIFPSHTVLTVGDASQAVESAADNIPDLVILEMSLSGHSGMEFLYEFRTYSDWAKIPVIIYTSIKIPDDILSSRAWGKLQIAKYLYKPEASLNLLKTTVEKEL